MFFRFSGSKAHTIFLQAFIKFFITSCYDSSIFVYPLCAVRVKLSALIKNDDIFLTGTYLPFCICPISQPSTEYIRLNFERYFFTLNRGSVREHKVISVPSFPFTVTVADTAFHIFCFYNVVFVA